MTDFADDLNACLKILAEGGIILYPTDTVWGIGCDATNEEAVLNLARLKGKAGGMGLIILLASERDILKYVTQPDLQVFDYLKTLHKPATIIYEGGTGVAESVLAPDGSIAIRLVQEDFCRHLLKRFRKPLVSTSANFSGEPTPRKFNEINEALKNAVDYVVRYNRDNTQAALPSSLIKWHHNKPPEILRF